jgi:hypothetical protein
MFLAAKLPFRAALAATVSNNGRQALPLLVRPRFQPGNQTDRGPTVYRAVGRPNFSSTKKEEDESRKETRNETTNENDDPTKQTSKSKKWLRFFESILAGAHFRPHPTCDLRVVI